MTDVLVRLLEQAAVRQPAVTATQTWVPTMSVLVPGGLLLPAPKTIGMPTSGAFTITGIDPCDGSAGWAWQVTTTEDGVIRDQRTVVVPDSVVALKFEDLVQVRTTDLHNLNADQVWVGLEDDPPPALFRGWWLVSAPGNPALGTETGSGDLRRVL